MSEKNVSSKNAGSPARQARQSSHKADPELLNLLKQVVATQQQLVSGNEKRDKAISDLALKEAARDKLLVDLLAREKARETNISKLSEAVQAALKGSDEHIVRLATSIKKLDDRQHGVEKRLDNWSEGLNGLAEDVDGMRTTIAEVDGAAARITHFAEAAKTVLESAENIQAAAEAAERISESISTSGSAVAQAVKEAAGLAMKGIDGKVDDLEKAATQAADRVAGTAKQIVAAADKHRHDLDSMISNRISPALEGAVAAAGRELVGSVNGAADELKAVMSAVAEISIMMNRAEATAKLTSATGEENKKVAMALKTLIAEFHNQYALLDALLNGSADALADDAAEDETGSEKE